MTSSHKFCYLLTILSLVVGISLLGTAVQSSSVSTPDIQEIWAESKDNTPNEWWVYVILSVDGDYWETLEFYSLKITIGEQTHEMIPDLAYETASPSEQAFFTSFSNIEAGTYQIMLQWTDGTTPKVWIDEEIQFGESVQDPLVEQFHQVVPVVLMITILALIVIFPGQKKLSSKIEQNEKNIKQEES